MRFWVSSPWAAPAAPGLAGWLVLLMLLSQPSLIWAQGIITTVAGTGMPGYSGDNGPATAARLNGPYGVAVDPAGNLFIADVYNNRIRRVSPDGLITTVAGTGTQGYGGDGGPATAARLNGPSGVAVDPAGNLFIVDIDNHRIRKVTPNGVITTVAGTGTDGYNGDNIAATAAQLNVPSGVTVDASGNLFIADRRNNRIRRVSPNGTITTVAGTGARGYSGDTGPATGAQLNGPNGVAVDPAGNLLIADLFNNRIRKVASNGMITTVAGTGTAGYNGDNIAAITAQFNSPAGVAVDASGNLFIADQYNHRIRRVSPGGTITTVAGTGTDGYNGDNGPATTAQLNRPSGVAVDASGNLLIADLFNHRIRRVTPVTAPFVITTTPWALTAMAARVGGNVVADGGAPVTERGVVYSSTNTNPAVGVTGVTQAANGAGTGTYWDTLTGLSPGTTYYVRAYATNSAGTGYGSLLSFTVPVSVQSITSLTPTPTATATVTYRVRFSGAIPGLNTSNFQFTNVTNLAPSVASVTGVGGSTALYDVVVNTGALTSSASTGTLQLTVVNTAGTAPAITLPTPAAPLYTITRRFSAQPQLRLQGGGSASGQGDVTAFVDALQVVTSGTASTLPNALTNGSFETNTVPPAGFQYAGGVSATPWRFGGSAGVARQGSLFGAAPSNNGDAVAFLQSSTSNTNDPSYLSQPLALPTGTYQLTFLASQRSFQGTISDQVVQAFVNDVFVGSIQPTTTASYQPFTSVPFAVTAPALTATITSAVVAPGATTASSPISFNVSFSQAVSNFVATDISVTNGTVTSFAGSGTSYSFSVTPSANGIVSVSLATNVATDNNNTGNSAAGPYSITYQALLIRYVRQGGSGDGSSWSSASGDLQAMIDAQGVQQVWVAAGRYTRSGGGSFAMKNNVGIYGGFVGSETSLASRPPVDPVAYQPSSTTLTVSGPGRVIQNQTLTSTSILDGVVIAGGNATDAGGGIFNYLSSPRVVNCLFQGNTATSGGGMYNNSSNPSVINCLFQGNTANLGGGVYNIASSPSLANCVFRGNAARQNAGGVYNFSGSSSLINCSFQGNTANQGGGVYNLSGSPSLINCSFQSNTASTQGGGMVTDNSNAKLINSSFRANTANQGGGIYNAGTSLNLTNCVLFDNGAGNTLVNVYGGSLRASYSLFDETVTGFTDGGNNLRTSVSPFVFSTLLNPCSEAIDAGDNAAYAAANGPATDLANSPRFYQNGRIDMGAYEYQGSPAQPVAIAQQPASSSSVTTGGSLSVPVSVSGSVNQYQWYKDNGNNPVSGQNSATLRLSNVQLSDAGAYSLVVTGDCNSVTSTAFSLTVVDPTPTLAGFAATPASVCAGSPVTFTATLGNVSGSYSFTLSNGTSLLTGTATGSPFSQTLAASGSDGQRLTLAVQTGNGPVATATTSLTVNAPFTVSLRPDGPLSCTRTSVTLTTSGGPSGATYVYSSGAQASAVSSATASVSQAGLYSVTATGPGGCSATATTQVQSDTSAPGATLSASPATTLSCAQTSLTLTAGGADTYQFSGPGLVSQGGNQAVVNAPGLYSVMVTRSSTGCTSTTSIAISQDNTAPSASLVSSGGLSCRATSVTLTAGPEGQAYRFSAGATPLGTTNRATVSSAGVYSVTVIGANGCSSVASTTVVGDQSVPLVGLSNDGPLSCTKTSVTLTASGVGTYQFSSGATPINGGPTATVTTAGVYSVTVTGANGCSSIASTTVVGDQSLPVAGLTNDGPLSCTKTSVLLTASGVGTYQFSTGATQINGGATASVSTAGVYSVTVMGSNGCSSVASTTVIGDQTATVAGLINDGPLSCTKTSVLLTASGVGTYRFSAGATPINGGPTANVTTAGVYSVTVVGGNGCTSVASTTVVSDQSVPLVGLSNDGPLSCNKTTVLLRASGVGTYRFSSGTTPVNDGPTATATTAGVYSVTVTASNGCSSIASTTVVGDQSVPVAGLTNDGPLSCTKTSVTLTASGEGTYRFSPGATQVGSGNTATVTTAGVYSVTVSSANGCVAMTQTTVRGTTDAPTAPTLAASPATPTTNQPITITASGCPAGTLNWTALGGSGQASGNTYTLAQPGNYTLSASCSLNGCTSSSSAPLSVQIRPGGFAITGVSMVNCQLIDEAKGGYQVQFTPQYAGQTSNPISFSVVNELAATTAPAPYSLRLYTDNPVITLVAAQAGSGEARFAYNWLASCQSGTSPNQPPTTTGIPSQTILAGQGYQLPLTTYFSDPDGQALSFQASGLPTGLSLTGSVISGTPTQTGVSSVNVTAIDPGGLPVSTSFQLTVSPQPVIPPSGFAIVGVSTVSCQVLNAGERRVTFTPQYAGVSGTPISFSVVNELIATTSPGPYSLNLYTDNPTITLSAQQGSAVSTYRYNWLAVCIPAARVSSGETGSSLTVRVLGNPVAGNTAEIEISGVTGQPVQLNLVDMQGKSVHAQRIDQAGEVERVSLPLGASNGILLLQVSTPTQRQQAKLLRTN